MNIMAILRGDKAIERMERRKRMKKIRYWRKFRDRALLMSSEDGLFELLEETFTAVLDITVQSGGWRQPFAEVWIFGREYTGLGDSHAAALRDCCINIYKDHVVWN